MIRLNCDLGESFGAWKMGQDELILPLIDLASVACGFHAGDPQVMSETISLAKKHSVSIGAHPSYPDLVGFGRRSLKCTKDEIRAFVLYQIGAIFAFCKASGARLEFVKPHGALYNDMMRDDEILEAILEAMAKFDTSLKLMLLSTSQNAKFEKIAANFGINLLFEVFADRNYTDQGFLVPRTQENAVIKDDKEVIKRLKILKNENKIQTPNGYISLRADCICVHGDNEEALSLVRAIKEIL